MEQSEKNILVVAVKASLKPGSLTINGCTIEFSTSGKAYVDKDTATKLFKLKGLVRFPSNPEYGVPTQEKETVVTTAKMDIDVPPAPTESINVDILKVAELKDLLSKAGIEEKKYRDLKKAEIVAYIKENNIIK